MMRKDPLDLDTLDQAIYRARIVAADAAHDEHVDREQWQRLVQRLGLLRRTSGARGTVAAHHRLARPIERRFARTAIWAGAGLVIVMACIASLTHRLGLRETTVPPRTYATLPGQRATVTLDDGSHVVLGPATTLMVRTGDRRNGTSVTVAGEALFTVVHRDDRPFVVRAGRAVTRVLGTTFLVRRYATDFATRIVVTDGRVAMRVADVKGTTSGTSSRDIVLSAAMLGFVSDSGAVRITPRVATDEYTGWVDGQLVFRQAPARDVAAELGRMYGVHIQVADSTVSEQLLTWTAPIGSRPMADVLNELAILVKAHVVRSHDVITLVPGRVSPRGPAALRAPNHFLTPEKRYGL